MSAYIYNVAGYGNCRIPNNFVVVSVDGNE